MSPHAAAGPIEDIVAIHLQAFRTFFLSALGARFLREYYLTIASYEKGILLAASPDGICVGFAAGFLNPPEFYRHLRGRRMRLGVAALLGVAMEPRRLPLVLANYRRVREVNRRRPDPCTAELSSLAVLPGATGRGVGSQLVEQFCASARSMGATRVILTTDAEGNEGVNRFYQANGFSRGRCYEVRPGRWLNEYARLL